MTHLLRATPAQPITVYYCKANVKTGLTVRLMQGKQSWDCCGILLQAAHASMIHGNSTGKPKASGARCVLEITTGIVGLVHPPHGSSSPRDIRELEINDMHALERDCLIFETGRGQENRHFDDVFDRPYFCKCL
jgi:hypothetical protein